MPPKQNQAESLQALFHLAKNTKDTLIQQHHLKLNQLPLFVRLTIQQQEKLLLSLFASMLFAIQTEEVYKFSQSITRSTAKTMRYTKAAACETPHFIGDCLSNDHAPTLFTYSRQLAWRYFIPVFFTSYIYYFLENRLDTHKENLPPSFFWMAQSSLMLLSTGLFLFSTLRKIELQLHTTILLMKLPPIFRKMKILHDIKKQLDTGKMLDAETQVDAKKILDIKKSVINAHFSPCLTQCNQLKFLSGNARALLIFFIRELTVLSVKQIPYLGSIASYAQMSFSGLAMTEYRLGDHCEEHRNKKFNEHGEWFFMFGLLFQLAIYATMTLIELLSFMPAIACERYLGKTFLLSGLAETFSFMPKTAYENYFNSIFMLFLVGLSYYVPFPKASEKASGPFFDFGTRAFTHFLIAGFSVQFKSMIENDGNAVTSDSALSKFLKFLDHCEFLTNKQTALIEGKTSSDIDSTPHYRPSLIKLARNKINRRASSFIYRHLKKIIQSAHPEQSSQSTGFYFYAVNSFFTPLLFRDFFRDPIVLEYWPSLIISINNTLDALTSSRQLALDIFSYTREINAFCTKRSVQWGAWLLGIGAITQIFTYEFIMNNSPAYLDDFLYLYKKVASTIKYNEAQRKVAVFKKNIAMIQKIIKELPSSSAQELFVLLQNENFLHKLAVLKSGLLGLLMKHEQGLASLGFAEVNAVEDPLLDVSNYFFPGDEGDDFHTVESDDIKQRSYEERLCLFVTTDAVFPESVKNAIQRSHSEAECAWPKKAGPQLFKPACSSDDEFVNDIPDGSSKEFREAYGDALGQPARESHAGFRLRF
ncbi:MAG: hypothetical protein NTZ67_00590 [Gammaproteobacteria bacterium]|nr:hypothetical protein [Gammaproteobacteria bacterium]